MLSLLFALTITGDPLTDLAQLRTDTQAVTLAPSYKALLVNIVDAAILRVQQGRPAAAVTLLRSYNNYVTKFVASGALSAADGQLLLDESNAIIGELSP